MDGLENREYINRQSCAASPEWPDSARSGRGDYTPDHLAATMYSENFQEHYGQEAIKKLCHARTVLSRIFTPRA